MTQVQVKRKFWERLLSLSWFTAYKWVDIPDPAPKVVRPTRAAKWTVDTLGNRPAPKPRITERPKNYYATAPATRSEDTSNDFLTGMLIGSLLSPPSPSPAPAPVAAEPGFSSGGGGDFGGGGASGSWEAPAPAPSPSYDSSSYDSGSSSSDSSSYSSND